MAFRFFSRNGEILPVEEAKIDVYNIAYSYGFGVYESVKVRKGVVYFLERHVERLGGSVEIIGLEHGFGREDVGRWVLELLEYEGVLGKRKDANIKILLIGGNTKEEAELFIILLAPLFPDRKLYREGAKTITVSYERLFPNAKTLNMLGSYLAFRKAKEAGCYDALLVDREANIVEGTRTNFFAMRGRRLFTPPREKVLEGVTKDTVLWVAERNGFEVEEGNIPLADVEKFDGVFLTSTSSKIMSVKQVNEVTFGVPEELRELTRLYDAFLDESKGIWR